MIPLPARLVRHRGAALAFSAVLLAGSPAIAAQFTWDNVTGNWSTVNGASTNWTPDVIPPANALDTELIFGGTGATSYTSTNDIAGAFQVNKLTLNSTATVAEIIAAAAGNPLSFTANGALNPLLTQSGSGAFTISSDVALVNALTLGGTGAGVTSLTGVISGAGGATFGAGNWQLTNIANSFSGGVNINTGANVELLQV